MRGPLGWVAKSVWSQEAVLSWAGVHSPELAVPVLSALTAPDPPDQNPPVTSLSQPPQPARGRPIAAASRLTTYSGIWLLISLASRTKRKLLPSLCSTRQDR